MASARICAMVALDPPNSTVISIGCAGYGRSTAGPHAIGADTAPAIARRPATRDAALLSMASACHGRQHLGDLDAAPLARRLNPGEDDGERRGPLLAVHLGLAPSAHGGRELLELVDDGVASRTGHRPGAVRSALEDAKALVEVVIGCRRLAVDIEQIVLGRGR